MGCCFCDLRAGLEPEVERSSAGVKAMPAPLPPPRESDPSGHRRIAIAVALALVVGFAWGMLRLSHLRFAPSEWAPSTWVDGQAGKQINQALGVLPGQAWDLGDGARLTGLADTPTGTALLVEYGAFRALLPGNFAPADLPNAGSFTAIYCFSDAQCAAVWQGRASLIFGESTPLSAAAHGWSHLTTDGTNVWISTQR